MKRLIITFPDNADTDTLVGAQEELTEYFGNIGMPLLTNYRVECDSNIEPKRMFFGGTHVWHLADGYKIVLVETLAEYRAEDRLMELHCSRWHGERDTDVLSLRDDISTPHVTFKVDHSNKRLIWIKGPRGTSDIVLKYRQLIKGWLDAHGFDSQNVLKI